jgi:hypothetical protein
MKNPIKRKSIPLGTTLDVITTGKLSYLQMHLAEGNKAEILRLGIDALYEKYRTDKSDIFIGLNKKDV